MTDSRSGWSSSASARATTSTTVVGRNAPASSWARVVRRASNSGAGRGVAALEGGLGMILANVRGRLRAQDFLLVALALARGDAPRRARYERLLLEEGPDELLDDPDLLAALLALRTLVVPSPASTTASWPTTWPRCCSNSAIMTGTSASAAPTTRPTTT